MVRARVRALIRMWVGLGHRTCAGLGLGLASTSPQSFGALGPLRASPPVPPAGAPPPTRFGGSPPSPYTAMQGVWAQTGIGCRVRIRVRVEVRVRVRIRSSDRSKIWS